MFTDESAGGEKVNILLVDDQPGKLLSYQVILQDMGENLLMASSATQALQILLRNEIAVLLVDVCMPDLDGFEFAAMVRNHPRFQKTAIIFISAIQISDDDSLRGYEMGAVDYVSVPVVPALLRAKVRVFVELYRKTKQLQHWATELEKRVAERTLELQQATERQELLSREVDHRAKNALAVVQAIVRLTKADDVEHFSKSVHGRIRAMAGAHTLLSASRWAGASLFRLVEEELAPFHHAACVEFEGPPLLLKPNASQSVAMALHELTTNAAKYGALSTEGGAVTVKWQVNGANLEILWKESGGPIVTSPQTLGFGSTVIRASIAQQLNGSVEFNWAAEGLCCTLQLPNTPQTETWMLQTCPVADEPALAASTRFSALWNAKILVVEDEALIGLMIEDALHDFGAKVVGPFNCLEHALANTDAFDAALLDVNLAGVTTYPIAAKLHERGCPFVFVTGYDEPGGAAQFAGAPILQKPIEPLILAQALSNAIIDARSPKLGQSRIEMPASNTG